MRIFLLSLFLLSTLGCNKPDPNPELLDGIYMDMQAQLGVTQKTMADIQKLLDEHQANLSKVKPQTGQIKYAEKRYWDTKNQIDLLLQQEKYWKIRIEERKKFARVEYLKAFRAGKPWPDPAEYEEYMSEKRLRQAKQQWNVKSRLEEFKKQEVKPANPIKE